MMAAGGGQGGLASIAERRAALFTLAQMAGDAPVPMAVEDMSVDGPGGPLPLRLYRPPSAPAHGPGLVYLHGGGWTAGGLDTYDAVCRALAAGCGHPLVAVGYRLAPEHPFPACLDDAEAAVRAVAADPTRFGIDPGALILAGDSAGANIAAALCGRLLDRGGPIPARLLLICPILDLAAEAPSRRAFAEGYFLSAAEFARDRDAYLGRVDPADPCVSPLRRADLKGFPPTDIHVAEFDPFRDEGVAYAERLGEAGAAARLTHHAGMIHYFYALSRAIPYARRALAGMV